MSFEKISKKEILAKSSPLLEKGRYTILGSLGSGGQATVFEILIPNVGEFALKTYHIGKSMMNPNDEGELLEALNEVYLEYSLLNQELPNVVRSHLYHFDEKKKEFCFTMCLMRGGDLSNLITNEGPMLYGDFFKVFEDVVTGN